MFSKPVGPCEIWWKGSKVGDSYGDIILAFTVSVFESKLAKTGETARGKYITGEEIKVTGEFGEVELSTLASICGGTVSEGATTDEVVINSQVGKNLLDDAGELILKPIIEQVTSTTASDWIYIPKATLVPNLSVAHGIATDKQWGFEFQGHPVVAADLATGGCLADKSYTAGDLIKFGDAD